MFELFKGLQVDWLGKRKLFISISMLLLLIGMVSLVVKGRFEYGTDFKGGTVVVVKFNETVDIGKVRDLLPEADIQTVQSSEGGSEFQIELAKAVENEDESVGSEAVTTALNKAFAGKFKIESSESVSAKVGCGSAKAGGDRNVVCAWPVS